jgi:hypothetical protein
MEDQYTSYHVMSTKRPLCFLWTSMYYLHLHRDDKCTVLFLVGFQQYVPGWISIAELRLHCLSNYRL